MALSSAWAARGDTVEARLDVRARPGVTVQLGTVGAQVMSVIGNSVWFSVPDDASLSGVQSVILPSGDRTFRGTLNLVTATPPAAVPASAKPDPKVREFLRYILSRQGQEDVARAGDYLPLTPGVVQAQRRKLD